MSSEKQADSLGTHRAISGTLSDCEKIHCPALGKCGLNPDKCHVPEDIALIAIEGKVKNPSVNMVVTPSIYSGCPKCGFHKMSWVGEYIPEVVRETDYNSVDLGMKEVMVPLYRCMSCGFKDKLSLFVAGKKI